MNAEMSDLFGAPMGDPVSSNLSGMPQMMAEERSVAEPIPLNAGTHSPPQSHVTSEWHSVTNALNQHIVACSKELTNLDVTKDAGQLEHGQQLAINIEHAARALGALRSIP